jgi:hypothetical protein
MRHMVRWFCFCLPLLLSMAALGIVTFALLTGQARPGGDEGAAAHLFHLLIAMQVPLIAGFVLTSDSPRAMAAGLAAQALAIATAFAPVLIAGL